MEAEKAKNQTNTPDYKIERSVSAPFNENDFLDIYESQKETDEEKKEDKKKSKKKKMNYFIKKYILTNIHNLTFSVSKIHIRLEENLISEQPFSLGFIIDVGFIIYLENINERLQRSMAVQVFQLHEL